MDLLPGNPPHNARRISQGFSARFKGLHRLCSLYGPWTGPGGHPITLSATKPCYRGSRYAAEYSSGVFSAASKAAAGGGEPLTAGNRRRGSRFRPFPCAVATAAAARRRRSSRATGRMQYRSQNLLRCGPHLLLSWAPSYDDLLRQLYTSGVTENLLASPRSRASSSGRGCSATSACARGAERHAAPPG